MKSAAGELFLRTCMTISGRLATTAIGLGPYLTDLVSQYSKRPVEGYYYGVDTALYKPVDAARRRGKASAVVAATAARP